MKHAILTEKESWLLEELIAKYGIVIRFENIYDLLKNQMTPQVIRNIAHKLTRKGWLVRIKRGVYAISTLEGRGFLSISPYRVAQMLLAESYISFLGALQYHNMFEQMLKSIVSISQKSFKTYNLENINYKFVKTKKDLYFGWQNVLIDGEYVKIAEPEKAILDILQFERNRYTVDIIIEIFEKYRDKLNAEKIINYSQKHSLTVQRVIGYIFDRFSIDSKSLYENIKSNRSSSYLTSDSKVFNAKWRLYHSYEKDLIK